MPKWTHDEAVAYECACEAITHWRAILTGEIAEESKKARPDNQRIKDLYAERSRLFRERASLRIKEKERIAKIRSEYGSRIRAWLEQYQAVAA